jgi:Raf kinase inhibitor-like YbhB/YbcL family protein
MKLGKILSNAWVLVLLMTNSPLAFSVVSQPGEKTMRIESSAFPNNGQIPTRLTCDGKDLSPPLSWFDLPPGTKSLVLIVDDPDAPDPKAPKMTWVHWVLYNIPATATGLGEGIAPESLPPGTLQGLNDWKRTAFGGPCPAPKN